MAKKDDNMKSCFVFLFPASLLTPQPIWVHPGLFPNHKNIFKWNYYLHFVIKSFATEISEISGNSEFVFHEYNLIIHNPNLIRIDYLCISFVCINIEQRKPYFPNTFLSRFSHWLVVLHSWSWELPSELHAWFCGIPGNPRLTKGSLSSIN